MWLNVNVIYIRNKPPRLSSRAMNLCAYFNIYFVRWKKKNYCSDTNGKIHIFHLKCGLLVNKVLVFADLLPILVLLSWGQLSDIQILQSWISVVCGRIICVESVSSCHPDDRDYSSLCCRTYCFKAQRSQCRTVLVWLCSLYEKPLKHKSLLCDCTRWFNCERNP